MENLRARVWCAVFGGRHAKVSNEHACLKRIFEEDVLGFQISLLESFAVDVGQTVRYLVNCQLFPFFFLGSCVIQGIG